MYRIFGLSSRSHGNKTQQLYWYFPYDHAISPLPGAAGPHDRRGDPSTWAGKYSGSVGANRATNKQLSFREAQHDGGNVQPPRAHVASLVDTTAQSHPRALRWLRTAGHQCSSEGEER